ncbi:MAG: argininosuccinate lyase [Clostridiales bacterium]|jgi:argininosuccinate lyase|nr:argininosuccinate lyase [Clostridiales bacterium]
MKLWGGRFKEGTNALLDQFNASIGFDYKLFAEDIEGSIAHGKMMCKIGVLTEEELAQIITGLRTLQGEIEAGTAPLTLENEDIHMNIEALLVEKIGPLGKKLHTGRSRNDQVALDFRLYTMRKTETIMAKITVLLETLYEIAGSGVEVIMPGYTHLQRAQPVRLAFHMMAYFQMFKRDYARFADALERMDVLPLGSGAMSGVNYPTDRMYLKELLGFSEVSDNAMDAVSDRDFAIEFQSAASILMMHLSRFSEELILWSSTEFKFIEISDQFTTGSSIMPQKKNPDAAELVRGKTGRVYGNLMALLTVMKGLPLAYNKDMQEDKEGLFDTVETVEICLDIFSEMLKDTEFLADNMRKAVEKGFLNATDLADYLVHKGLSFRDCHAIAGKITAYCIEKDSTIEALSLEELKQFSEAFEADVYAAIDIETVIENKASYGSTSRKSVLESLEKANAFLKTL